MDQIIVCDNFLTQPEIQQAVDILKKKSWKFNNTDDKYITPFWNINLIQNDYFAIFMKNEIELFFKKKFTLIEVYASGQTFGQDSTYDNNIISNVNAYTFCMFFTDLKKEDIDLAGGYLYIKFPEEKYKICYEPLFNRGLFFPSSYINKSAAFGRFFMDMKISVYWKLEEVV